MAKVEKKVTASGIISEGIGKGQSVKMILSRVAKKLPESKADETHVKFYARKALKAGNLDAELALKKYGVKPPRVAGESDQPSAAKAGVVKKPKTPKTAKASSKKSAGSGEKKPSVKRKVRSKA